MILGTNLHFVANENSEKLAPPCNSQSPLPLFPQKLSNIPLHQRPCLLSTSFPLLFPVPAISCMHEENILESQEENTSSPSSTKWAQALGPNLSKWKMLRSRQSPWLLYLVL